MPKLKDVKVAFLKFSPNIAELLERTHTLDEVVLVAQADLNGFQRGREVGVAMNQEVITELAARINELEVTVADLHARAAELRAQKADRIELPPPKPESKFNVRIDSAGQNKIGVIKAIRSVTNLGLKEAKDLADAASPNSAYALSDVVYGKAQAFAQAVREAGGSTSIFEVL